MIRVCLSTATSVQAEKKANGKWSVDGLGKDSYIEALQLWEQISLPFNASFHLTTEASECFDRLKNNLSDITNVFLPIDSVLSGFRVPQPLSAGTLSFITGYNISDGERETKDFATVFSNADLLEPKVYCWALFLIALFVTFIALRIMMFYHLTKRIVKITRVEMIRRQLTQMFYYKSEQFKWITFLHSLLCFIMVTCFLCLYKTSHIIVEKPFYPKNYQESLDHPSSLAFYYDQFSVVSTAFKKASPESIRGRMWAKLVMAGRQNDYSEANVNGAALPVTIQTAAEQMTAQRSILILSPLVIPLFRSAFCGFSPEGELWIMKVTSDPIEKEVIYGYAQGDSFNLPWFSSKMEALFETDYLARTYEMQFDQSDLISSISGTSRSHQSKQRVVCEDESALAPEPVVRSITVSYFASFFKAILIIWLLAFILNIFQILQSET